MLRAFSVKEEAENRFTKNDTDTLSLLERILAERIMKQFSLCSFIIGCNLTNSSTSFPLPDASVSNYGDVTYILEFLKHPLVTEEEIEERQKVVMAAYDNTPFIYELRKVIVQTWEDSKCITKSFCSSKSSGGSS